MKNISYKIFLYLKDNELLHYHNENIYSTFNRFPIITSIKFIFFNQIISFKQYNQSYDLLNKYNSLAKLMNRYRYELYTNLILKNLKQYYNDI